MIKQEEKKSYSGGLDLLNVKETKYSCSGWENLPRELTPTRLRAEAARTTLSWNHHRNIPLNLGHSERFAHPCGEGWQKFPTSAGPERKSFLKSFLLLFPL